MKTTIKHAFVMMIVVAINTSHVVIGADDDAPKPQPNELLSEMRMRAAATKVVTVANGKRVLSKVSAQPLFRFSDQPRDILDATLWAYGTPGRPVALQKVEVYQRPDGQKWFYCMTSLSEDLIESQWRDGQTWATTEPGIKFHKLAGGPKAAETQVKRLFQMKQIARRFDASLFDANADQRVEMRQLPRPIHRYADPKRGIQDGVIFGYTTAGTNPDALLSIELQGQANTGFVWKYGLARITLCEVSVHLDDKQVWQVPYVLPKGPGRPSKFETWLFFDEAELNEELK